MLQDISIIYAVGHFCMHGYIYLQALMLLDIYSRYNDYQVPMLVDISRW